MTKNDKIISLSAPMPKPQIILNQRQMAILEELRERKICWVRDLKTKFDASGATLHRDLERLEGSGLVTRGHGSVVLTEFKKPEHFIGSRLAKNVAEKQEIADKAVRFIENEMSIFLDHSSTCAYLAKAIAKKEFRHLVLVTNSLVVAGELEDKNSIDLILTGGNLEHSWSSTMGASALEDISEFNFDQAFISCGMVSLDRGARTNYSFVAEITKKACESALETNLLVDSSKFIKAGAYLIRKASTLTRIITDKNIDPIIVKAFKKAKVNLVI